MSSLETGTSAPSDLNGPHNPQIDALRPRVAVKPPNPSGFLAFLFGKTGTKSRTGEAKITGAVMAAAASPSATTATTALPSTLPRTSVGGKIPLWLRRKSSTKPPRIPTTPRQASWWIGVVWISLSALLLGFVGHVTLFGALQHSQSQKSGYEDLRSSLAQATTPLGQLDVDEKLVAAGTPIALITIPKLTLTEVVREGTSSDQTRQGVGHRRDSVMPGQAGTSVLYGRQAGYGGPFGALASLVPGDTITATTGQGKKEFTVTGLRRAGDTMPTSLKPGRGRLELVTADGPALAPFGVLYVDADLKGMAASTPAQAFGEKSLPPAEEVMGSDPGALLSLIFALQWLVVAALGTRWLARVWGRGQAWIVMSPLLLILGSTAADAASAVLPNLM
ncbi:MAG: class E sortase [Microbacteriaceae bacterium]|nr:class E sortase [Microbacteriaceae bacterium]